MVAETLKLLKKTENKNVSEKIFTEKELDELINEKSDSIVNKKDLREIIPIIKEKFNLN